MEQNYAILLRGEYNAIIELINDEKYQIDVRFQQGMSKEEQDAFILHTANEAYGNMNDISLIQPSPDDLVAIEKPSWWARFTGAAK